MLIYYPLYYGETQAGPGAFAGCMGLFRLVKPLKQMGNAFFIYPLSRILNGYNGLLFICLCAELKAAAVRGKLYGIVY